VAFDNINTGMQIAIMMRKPRLMAAAKIARCVFMCVLPSPTTTLSWFFGVAASLVSYCFNGVICEIRYRGSATLSLAAL
jgi:hypothetical protein